MGLRNSLMGYKVALWPEGCLLVGGCSLFGSSVRMRPGKSATELGDGFVYITSLH